MIVLNSTEQGRARLGFKSIFVETNKKSISICRMCTKSKKQLLFVVAPKNVSGFLIVRIVSMCASEEVASIWIGQQGLMLINGHISSHKFER